MITSSELFVAIEKFATAAFPTETREGALSKFVETDDGRVLAGEHRRLLKSEEPAAEVAETPERRASDDLADVIEKEAADAGTNVVAFAKTPRGRLLRAAHVRLLKTGA